jgi:hypothetical protein
VYLEPSQYFVINLLRFPKVMTGRGLIPILSRLFYGFYLRDLAALKSEQKAYDRLPDRRLLNKILS